jgi:hypothetical protein
VNDPRGIRYSALAKVVSDKICSRPTFDKYLSQLKHDRLLKVTQDPENATAVRITLTPDAEHERVYLKLQRQIDRLDRPTTTEHDDLWRQLLGAIDEKNDEEIKRLATHPAQVKLFRIHKILIAAYSAFYEIHPSLPAGIYVCVKDGKLEFLTQEYLTYLKERKQNRRKK